MTVNRLNGGASVIYIDFSLTGGAIPLELIRTYNSITALNEQTGWSGAFGWGWTSPFETTLTFTPERHVLLRDGSTGNTVTFKSDKEDPRLREQFIERVRVAYFETKLGKKLTPEDKKRLELPEEILSRLKTDPKFRGEAAFKYKIPGQVPRGELLVSSEFGYQTLQFKNNQWIREKDGITQRFDKEGRLVRQQDKNGAYFDYLYSRGIKGMLSEITDQDHSLSLKFTWRQERVAEITDNRGHRAKYTYDKTGNLTQLTDPNNLSYNYRYSNAKFPHLLTRIEYSSESKGKDSVFRELRYDDNGLAVYHREKDGRETAYTYGRSTSDPENDFWTKAITTLGGAKEETYDEYFVKAKSDGSKYLYKQESRDAGLTTVTVFSACCGKPLQVTKNGETTNYKYFEDGLLQEKIGPKEQVKLEYDPRWKKVSKVEQNGTTSNYSYDAKGNLIQAANSRKEKVALKYDKTGRIQEMIDGSNRKIDFEYGGNGKPTVIAEKGIGTIRINYAPDGRIISTATLLEKDQKRQPTEAESQNVVHQVMQSFQNLLEIIRPAGVGQIL